MEGDPVVVRCPWCLKPEQQALQDFLCANCHRDKIEAIRNSCLLNDTINGDNRDDINRIFEISECIRRGEIPKGLYSSQSMVAIKVLSLLLIKRELLNKAIRLRNIELSTLAIQQKVIKLNEQIVNKEHETKEQLYKINTMGVRLLHDFDNKLQLVEQETSDLKKGRIIQIRKQAIQLQYQNFKVLKEICLGIRNKGHIVLLFNQPVISIEDFFEYNNKLFYLNGFLENLIKLQMHLVRILDIKVPYLEELISYFPDTDFYNLVQQKENFMINGGELEQNSDDDDEVGTIDVGDLDMDDPNKIVKLGGTIKLPLSSKTINNQLRRASMARANSFSKDNTPDPQSEALPSPQLSPTKPQLKSNLSGKRVVIVPHKILTKPLTKLTSKEYLKLLLIIVKILVNFKVILSNTIGRLPKNTLGEEKDYDIKSILFHIIKIDEYFEHELMNLNSRIELDQKSNSPHLSQYSESASSKVSTLTHSLISFIGSQEINHLKSTPQPPTGLKNLYNLFREPKKPIPERSEIYGKFSVSTPTPEITNIKYNEKELQQIMQTVHQVMLKGSNRSHIQTPSMVNSTQKLDDWDIVSKMYS